MLGSPDNSTHTKTHQCLSRSLITLSLRTARLKRSLPSSSNAAQVPISKGLNLQLSRLWQQEAEIQIYLLDEWGVITGTDAAATLCSHQMWSNLCCIITSKVNVNSRVDAQLHHVMWTEHEKYKEQRCEIFTCLRIKHSISRLLLVVAVVH